MKRMVFLIELTFVTLIFLSTLVVDGHKTVNTDKPLIPFENFSLNDIFFDGLHNETGFKQIIITTADDTVITTFWRQNGNDLHVVLSANKFAWVALGWSSTKPVKTNDVAVLKDMKIVLGTNDSITEYNGTSNGLSFALNSDIEGSYQFTDMFGIYIEFVIPLKTNNSSSQSLLPKTFNYFMFAVGDSYNVNRTITNFGDIYYLPGVYVESSAREGYGSNALSYGKIEMIVLSLVVFGLISKFKRKFD